MEGDDKEVTAEPTATAADNWETLIEPANQGAPTPAAKADDAAPATPSKEVEAPTGDKTTDAKPAADATGKPATDDAGTKAPDAVTDKPAEKAAPPVVEKPEGEKAPEAKADAKAEGEEDEPESEEDKKEFADLPAGAQAPARRYRKESRQFQNFKRDVGGEPFLEDAKLIVPTFHMKPASEFEKVLAERSPQKHADLYRHMVFKAIDSDQDRPLVIKDLVATHRAELITALGVKDEGGAPDAKTQPESATEGKAPDAQAVAEDTASLATIEELLADPYNNEQQKAALTAAKNAITERQKDRAETARLRTENESLKTTTQAAKKEPSAAEVEENELGVAFVGQVRSHADERLTALGLSVADGDPPELVTYINNQRNRILTEMSAKFEQHEDGKGLAELLTEKFKLIPSLRGTAKEQEKATANKFLLSAKAVVEDILGKEVVDPLFAIEARRTQQAPKPKDERQEIVGHESPQSVPGQVTLTKGKGVDALWAGLGVDQDGFSRASR